MFGTVIKLNKKEPKTALQLMKEVVARDEKKVAMIFFLEQKLDERDSDMISTNFPTGKVSKDLSFLKCVGQISDNKQQRIFVYLILILRLILFILLYVQITNKDEYIIKGKTKTS